MRPGAGRAAKALAYAIALVAVACCLLNGLDTSNETDKWFLLATGRQILREGIPLANPWSIETGTLGIVVQQWLHDVLLWRAWDVGGEVGVALVVLAMSATAIAASLAVTCAFAGRGLTGIRPWMTLAATGAFCLVAVGWLTLRPSTWTLAATLAAVAACERTRRDGRLPRLLALPALMVALMQLHMSMAWLAAFAVGCFALPASLDEVRALPTPEGRRAYVCAHCPFLLACLVMVLVMPLNPYGFDGMLYLFRSFGAASYEGTILEMKPVWDPMVRGGVLGFALRGALVLVALALCVRRHVLRPDVTLLCAVCLVASALQSRNGWLPAIPLCAMTGLLTGSARDDMPARPQRAAVDEFGGFRHLEIRGGARMGGRRVRRARADLRRRRGLGQVPRQPAAPAR